MFKSVLSRPLSRFTRCTSRRLLSTIDLRSDTVTKPTVAMLNAVQHCSVGDDVYGEDPTVGKLEECIAELTGHEAGLFCASTTMANQLALRSHLKQPPHSILCDKRAHIYQYECGGVAYHSQAATTAIIPENGIHLTAEEVEANLVGEDVHNAPTRVITLENTLNGVIFPWNELTKISQLARQESILLHLDGARLWNASVASGISLREYGGLFDSISLCLSKGMGCPIGSMLVGSKSFINQARWFRKLFGGGWRQAGILASMGLVALEDYTERMAVDHLHAAHLAKACEHHKLTCQLPVDTNMIFLNTGSVSAINLAAQLQRHNILTMPMSESTLRIVLHHQISKQDIDYVIATLPHVLTASELDAKACTDTTIYYRM
ncbi:pyridoxal phosphate-dependent transferase [Syncephalis plumigaleata]|nr:pyridoxal phosphate-dependent transferase [Syncephalis plumigaleata]